MHVQFLVVGGCVHAHPCRCVCVLVSAEGRGVRFPMYCASYTTMVRLRAGALARLVRVRAHGVAFRYWFAETHTHSHTHMQPSTSEVVIEETVLCVTLVLNP